jgi:hypothetical protein
VICGVAGLSPDATSTKKPTEPGENETFRTRAKKAVADLKQKLEARAERSLVVSTVIATLPDPIDSGLVYSFETMLQALRLGFETAAPENALSDDLDPGEKAGWFRDRSFLPWADRQVGTQNRALSEACRRSVPGLLLFRNSDLAAPRVLMVFVVGETPTSGVHGAALTNALHLASWLATDKLASRRILGPSFSGSAYSLRVMLEAFSTRLPKAKFELISGTASGSGLSQMLRDNERMAYSATTVPEDAASCAYLRYLHCGLGVDLAPLSTKQQEDSADSRAEAECKAKAGSSDDPVRLGPPRKLEGVAILHESGTEFGARMAATELAPAKPKKAAGQSEAPAPESEASVNRDAPGCAFQSSLDLSFPERVSMLRDAYESLEQRERVPPELELAMPRSGLDATLAESRTAPELEANVSAKTRAAVDTTLRRVLGEISRYAIRHVSIHATDMGDALFLARRIRDVAPDVRIAFFEPDDVLLHAEHRAELVGSLVVSPYPFLGVSDFGQLEARDHLGFPNASSQGLFNAVLAQRGASTRDLFHDPFQTRREPAPLLIWTSTIARTGLIPLDVAEPDDPERTIFRKTKVCADRALGAYCDELNPFKADPPPNPNQTTDLNAATNANAVRQQPCAAANHDGSPAVQSLCVESSRPVPRVWNFALLVLVLLFGFDWLAQARSEGRLSEERMPDRVAGSDKLPADSAHASVGDERAADRAIGRTKWWLYATIRRLLFAIAFCYVTAMYTLASAAKELTVPSLCSEHVGFVVSLACFFGAVWSVRRAGTCLHRDYRAFASYVGAPLFRAPAAVVHANYAVGSAPSGASMSESSSWRLRRNSKFAADEAVGRLRAARQSFRQLQVTTWSAALLAAGFGLLVVLMVAAPASYQPPWQRPVASMTLYVNRTLPLMSGVSPAMPLLLCIACVYVCAVGRMSRLLLAHHISRITPRDREYDLASTPIRLVMYPDYDGRSNADEGFTQTERDLLNAVWRPIAFRAYTFGAAAIIVVPWALFILKPLSTLELSFGNLPLLYALMVSAALIGIVLLQLLLFWTTLSRLLQRMAAHPLAAAFDKLPEFARDSIERQLSGSSDTLLRWVLCARQLDMLVKLVPPTSELVEHAAGIRAQLQSALRLAGMPELRRAKGAPLPPQDAEASALAELVVGAAEAVSKQLHESSSEVGHSAAAVAQAQAFVASVLALLVQRHVRQLRYYMSTLVAASMLLLLAVASYPFEPYRLLLSCLWVIVGAIVAVGLWIYVQLSRNPLIHSMTQSQVSRLSLSSGIAWRVFAWAILPLVSVAAAQFPSFANMLLPLLSPFLRALH